MHADDYDYGHGNNYNEHYGSGYYGDEHGNFQSSAASAAASSSGRRLLGDGYSMATTTTMREVLLQRLLLLLVATLLLLHPLPAQVYASSCVTQSAMHTCTSCSCTQQLADCIAVKRRTPVPLCLAARA